MDEVSPECLMSRPQGWLPASGGSQCVTHGQNGVFSSKESGTLGEAQCQASP